MWNLADSIRSRDRQGAVAQVPMTITGAVSRRIFSFVIGAAILSLFPLLAQGAEIAHVKWENLSMVTGRTVRIFLAGGSITGKAGGVEDDALVVDVRKTSDRNAYPKGMLRVPRENLHRLEMRTKGKMGRAILTSLGAIVGVGGGIATAYFGVDQCDFFGCRKDRPIAAGVAAVGITAAGVVGGYFAGNALDKHWTAIEILP